MPFGTLWAPRWSSEKPAFGNVTCSLGLCERAAEEQGSHPSPDNVVMTELQKRTSLSQPQGFAWEDVPIVNVQSVRAPGLVLHIYSVCVLVSLFNRIKKKS